MLYLADHVGADREPRATVVVHLDEASRKGAVVVVVAAAADVGIVGAVGRRFDELSRQSRYFYVQPSCHLEREEGEHVKDKCTQTDVNVFISQ